MVKSRSAMDSLMAMKDIFRHRHFASLSMRTMQPAFANAESVLQHSPGLPIFRLPWDGPQKHIPTRYGLCSALTNNVGPTHIRLAADRVPDERSMTSRRSAEPLQGSLATCTRTQGRPPLTASANPGLGCTTPDGVDARPFTLALSRGWEREKKSFCVAPWTSMMLGKRGTP